MGYSNRHPIFKKILINIYQLNYTKMKKQILISMILLSLILTMKAQWYDTNPLWTNSNVGIGLNSPSGRLHVDMTVGNYFRLSLGSTYDWEHRISSGNGDYYFYDVSNESYPLVIQKSNGYLGIGTVAPNKKLHVMTGSIYTPTTYLFGGVGNVLSQGPEPAFALSQDLNSNGLQTGAETAFGGMGFIYINSSDYNNLRIGTQTNNKVIFRSNNLDRMTISNDGRIGIGLTSPSQLLHLYSENPVLRFEDNTVTTGFDFNINVNEGAMSFACDNDGAKYSFNNGNLGIGAISPNAKLHIPNGDAIIGGNESINLTNINGTLAVISKDNNNTTYPFYIGQPTGSDLFWVLVSRQFNYAT